MLERSCPSAQGGFGVAVALFLVLGIAGLGAALSYAVTAQNRNVAMDVAGTEAFFAASAGLDYGVYQVFKNTACASVNLVPAAWGGRYTVTVTCSASAFNDGGALNIYEITATACNRPSAGACPGAAGEGYVERQLRAAVEGP